MLHVLFLLFFCSLNNLLHANFSANDHSGVEQQTQVFNCLTASFLAEVDQQLPDEFLLTALDFKVDAKFDQDELVYLTGLALNSIVTKTDVKNAVFYLQQTQRFSQILLEVTSCSKGLALTFHMHKSPILHRVVITGFLRGKDRIKNIYLIDIGERFDEQKHRYSIEQMVAFLQDQGYGQASVQDCVTIDPATKDVVVSCSVKKGCKFQIGQIQVLFDNLGSVAPEEIIKLQAGIQRLCEFKIQGKACTFEFMQNLQQRIKRFLEHHGCIDFEVQFLKKLSEIDKTVDLEVHVSIERKREFVFRGATFFTPQQLVEHLLLYGKSTWYFPSSLIVDEIEQLYKNKGFWEVAVSVKEEKDRVYCFIKQGPRTKITQVKFEKNNYISDEILTKACGYLLKSKYFDQDLCKKACDKVIKIYKQAGFWDAKIVKESFQPDKKEHSSILVLTLHEANQRILGSMLIPQHPELEQQVNLLWKHCCNKGFDIALLQEQQQWIVRNLKNKGYQKVVVDYSLQESSQGVVNVVWNVQLTESAIKMGKAIIIGNCKVDHKLLMQEVAYDYGDDWDKNKIETTLQNLRNLTIFDSVQIFPSRESDANIYKPLYLKLVEADRYEIKTRFGLQQVGRNLQFRRGFTYKLGATVGIKNPSRAADQYLLEADITRFYRNISASYQFPWFLGYKIACQLKIYDSLYQQPVYIGSQNSLYKGTQQGFLWNMTYAHTTKKHGRCVVSGSTGVEFMGAYQADQPKLSFIIDYDPAFVDKKVAYVFVEPTFLWQKVDVLLNPHKGFVFFASCKGMFDLNTQTSFFKCLVEHTQYFSLLDQFVIALRGRCGHIFNRAFDQINPIERFYLGGASSLRGYERDYCPPLGLLTEPIYDQHAGLPPTANNWWRYAPQGGRTMFNFNAEIRWNVYKNLGGVIFNDIGALFKHSIYDECKTGPDNFFGGSGLGFRYDTPIGPLRFDVGFKWKVGIPDFQSRHVLYLTLGQAF